VLQPENFPGDEHLDLLQLVEKDLEEIGAASVYVDPSSAFFRPTMSQKKAKSMPILVKRSCGIKENFQSRIRTRGVEPQTAR
jgi:hypothetical protein